MTQIAFVLPTSKLGASKLGASPVAKGHDAD
jgi:hypothetical protein